MDKKESSKQERKITDIDADAEVNQENVYNLDMAHEETVLSMQDVDVQSERINADVKKADEEMVEVMEIAKIIVDEVQSRQSDVVRKYQALKRKPVLVAQARKNMMIYLKNMVGFKMDFFKGMSY
nr:hypothetical protein [Tanacetum cinerariifolium]